ncbi:MAG: slipin family protein [Bacteroidetes bacterium]|nr:slipin family protein [Bacteroidota bacterium]
MIQKIIVNKYQKALVFNNKNEYVKMLNEGSYWVSFMQNVYVYDMDKMVNTPIDVNIILQDSNFANAVTVVDVKDNEIVLMYVNDFFNSVLTAGKYVFWNSFVNYKFVKADISNVFIDSDIEKSILSYRSVSIYTRVFVVEAYEKAVLYIDGSMHTILDAGTYYFWKNSTSIAMYKVDVRAQQIEMSGQEILTKDKANIRMNVFASYKVDNILKAIADNKDFEKQLYVAFQLALREYVGMYIFDELMEKKESIEAYVRNSVKAKAEALGIAVLSFGVRDVILPGDVKEIMNQVLIAEKKAQANVIMRREETASTRSLMNTAKLMEDNPMLYKLKEMEFVEKIADNINGISVNGNTALLEQLKTILVPK